VPLVASLDKSLLVSLEIILERILNDEQQHVQFGSKWFYQQCHEQQLEPEASFKKLVLKYFNNKPKGPFNTQMRLNAGLTTIRTKADRPDKAKKVRNPKAKKGILKGLL
jgi:uncharacterized ferritin-like protein (DUF455 family)